MTMHVLVLFLMCMSLQNQYLYLSVLFTGPGTGVPFHIHGPTFAETIYGRKVYYIWN